MKIDIVFEDEYIVVIDKPAGILVHPTEAGEINTIVSWLIEKYPDIKKLNWPDKTRAGIVHRLDKDTSGLLILAKTPEVLEKLQELFKSRQIQKTYLALVLGKILPSEGKIEVIISRGEDSKQKASQFTYSFSKSAPKPALTEYNTIESYKYDNEYLTLTETHPKTGRMHQIRVSFAYIDHPIIGDPLYNTKMSRQISRKLNLSRQFLHAAELEFEHPMNHEKIVLKSNSPDDLQNILDKLTKEL